MLHWDEEACDLVPSGLHYFEGDPALQAGRTIFPMPPRAVTDPQVGGQQAGRRGPAAGPGLGLVKQRAAADTGCRGPF